MKYIESHRSQFLSHGWFLFALLTAFLLCACGGSDNNTAKPATPGRSVTPTMPDPVFTPSANEAVIYYHRPDGNYDGWVLHLWNSDGECDSYTSEQLRGIAWPNGPEPTATDPNYGAYWVLKLKEGYGDCANYIIHKGDEKDPNSNDQRLDLTTSGNPKRWTFAISGTGIFGNPVTANNLPVTIAGASAHWLDTSTIVWNPASADERADVRLYFSADATLTNTGGLTAAPANQQVMLTSLSGGLSAAQRARVPHLTGEDWVPFTHTASVARVRELVRHQLILAAHDSDGSILKATRVQAAKVLDDLYTSASDDADEQELGVRYADNGDVAISVWAPTATAMKLKVYNDDASKSVSATQAMTYDDNTGIWSYTGTRAALDRKFYRFELTVFHHVTGRIETYEATDPYSLSLSANGRYSQFVNLDDANLKPQGWDAHSAPAVGAPEDLAIYESHIRDFSIRDTSVSAANRGKYLAFTESSSDGMTHLGELQQAGMNTFHILPSFDYSTVNENTDEQIGLGSTVAQLCARMSAAPVCGNSALMSMTVQQVLESYDPDVKADETKAQALVQSMRSLDGFNWGYDPQHYSVPEGGYASDPDGPARILEMRSMIKALHEAGYRVAADVVYNHTSTSGVSQNSVLDKLVPGYYHRYSETTGAIEKSTCCENTATEHRMFHKLMEDSLLVWARDYRFDAFRFDLMGHSPRASILEALEAVRKVDADTYFYGEGWNFGEVASNRLFEQAAQGNLSGTGVGTFNDRPRDPIRDAAMFNTTPDATGVDIIRAGLAGTLSDYVLQTFDDAEKAASQLPRAAYATDPSDVINYVSKHDNETLWDRLQIFLPNSITHSNRVRIFHIASALPLMSQGVPFLQLGGDLMRSKSLDRNSYDAGDWFNHVDFTKMTNNWDVGLPLAEDNENSSSGGWAKMRTVLANPNINPTSADIQRVSSVFREFLRIRMGSPLFRLRTGAEIIARVGFHNTGSAQKPGVILMSIDDGTGQSDLDSNVDAIVVAINGTASAASVDVSTATGFGLHSVQAASADPVVRTASFSASGGVGSFSIPAYTMAVFVKAQSGAQGAGLVTIPDRIEPRYTEGLKLVNSADQTKTNLLYSVRSGIYSGSSMVGAGTFTFRLQTDDQSHDLGFSDVQAGDDSVALSAGTGGAISFSAARNGLYSFRLDASSASASPVLTVAEDETIHDCSEIDLPASRDPYPFIFDNGDSRLYVRGNHSNWAPQPKFVMLYKGENRYQTLASFEANNNVSVDDGVLPVQFKLASSDDSWATQLYVQSSAGSTTINSGVLDTDTPYKVALGDAGVSNNTISLRDGSKYSFLLTLTPQANPNPGADVGTLLIQRCE